MQVVELGDGVQVHDAVDALVLVLQGDVVLDRAEVVAQMLPPGGPRAGEHPAEFSIHDGVPLSVRMRVSQRGVEVLAG